jgi:patatin-like phospholipase/acyl hydrolase
MSNETPDAFYARLKPEGKRLMLSIDGGGAKGYMTLRCLAKLEEMTGQPAYEIFDCYAGTSTGSLIAAGLAVGLNAQQLIGIYKNNKCI